MAHWRLFGTPGSALYTRVLAHTHEEQLFRSGIRTRRHTCQRYWLMLLNCSCFAAVFAQGSIPVADEPYEEMISGRMPFSGWGSITPTGWELLPCENVTSMAVAPVQVGTRGTLGRATLLCSSGALLDASTRLPYIVNGIDFSAPTWRLVQGMASPAQGSAILLLPLIAVSDSQAVLLKCTASASSRGSNSTDSTAGACVGTTLLSGPPSGPGIPPTATGLYSQPHSTTLFMLWMSSNGGTFAYTVNTGLDPPTAMEAYSSPAAATAMAYSSAASLVALGNSTVLQLLQSNASTQSFSIMEWVWVTNVSQGWGAPIDDVITALEFDDAATGSGTGADPGTSLLYIGNPTCLNIRFPDGTYSRLAGVDGLPYGNITALSVDNSMPVGRDIVGARRLWIGTDAGAILFDPSVKSGRATQTPLSVPWGQRWRYFAGARWIPTPSTSTPVQSAGLMSIPDGSGDAGAWPHSLGPFAPTYLPNQGVTLVLSGDGIAAIQSTAWTLAAKAAYYERTLPLFDLAGPLLSGGTGLVAGCNSPAFGQWDACTTSPDENNGLWSSLLVTSFAAKYNVTQDEADASLTSNYLSGLVHLNTVTGISGLFARATLPPGFPPPPPRSAPKGPSSVFGNGSAGRSRSASRFRRVSECPWHNSTALPGWTWEGDTSSDEVCGHIMSYTAVMAWLAGAPTGSTAAALPSLAATTLGRFVRYVVLNNLTLVDITGKPTTWGHWDPPSVVWEQANSDTRGLNSMQALAFLAGGLAASEIPFSGLGLNDTLAFTSALQTVLGPGNAYARNAINTKIIAPDDDNYSDDELAFFASQALVTAVPSGTGGTTGALLRNATLASMSRSWSLLSFTRPAAWAIMALGQGLGASGPTGKKPGIPVPDPASAMADALWTLRGWPLEPVDWPVLNSVRQDMWVDPETDRDFSHGREGMRVLPPNERPLSRLNADPRDFDGGGGMSATDPGAFLLPYWLARVYGLLGPPA